MAHVENNQQQKGEEELKTFKERLEDMPAYNMTVNGIQSMYNSLKGYESISGYINTAENVAGSLTNAAKPVVLAATDMAFKVAKPVVGEVKDPVASIDGCAAEVLAKVQEKVPCVKQDPYQMVESAKCSAKNTANYYMERVQGLTMTQAAVKQIDNAVSFSDLVVELCLPTDACSIEDMTELERQEESEDQGVIARARNVQEKACRRGTRKLMSYTRVRNTVDMVQFVQNRLSETTGKLMKGSNYVPSNSSSQPIETSLHEELNNAPSSSSANTEETDERDFLSEEWESIHKTSMFLPKKALEMTGEVYTSAKEIIFVYSSTNALKEMPSNVVSMVESYYHKINQNGLIDDVKDKVVSFAYVPTQVITNYMQSNRLVQWIIPNSLQQEQIQVIEIVNEDDTQ